MEVCEKLLFNRMSLLQSRWKLFGLETRKHCFFPHRCQSIPFMYIYSRLYDIFSIHIHCAKTRTNTINRIHIAVLMWFNSIQFRICFLFGYSFCLIPNAIAIQRLHRNRNCGSVLNFIYLKKKRFVARVRFFSIVNFILYYAVHEDAFAKKKLIDKKMK